MPTSIECQPMSHDVDVGIRPTHDIDQTMVTYPQERYHILC